MNELKHILEGLQITKKKKNSEKVSKNTKFLEIKEQRPEDVHKTLERLDKMFQSFSKVNYKCL